MSDFRYEPIEPARVPLSEPAPSSEPPSHWRNLPWIGLSLLALVSVALVVVFLLPHWIAPDAPERELTPSDVASATEKPAPAAPGSSQDHTQDHSKDHPQATPQDNPQQTAARRETQALLPRLIGLQQELEERGVAIWAAAPHEESRTLIADGDAQYRQRDFVAALALYRQAEQQLLEVQNDLPTYLQEALEAGRAALEAGDADSAQRHFELALTMDPNNEDALRGQARLERLAEVLAALERAAAFEREGDLSAALAAFEEALTLDNDSSAARQGRDRLREAVAQQRYQAALDRGFAAFQTGDDAAAQRAFREALAVRPGADVARSGLAQAEDRAAHRQVTAALQEARDLEQQERWAEAERIYARLQEGDASLVDARDGQLRAAARAQLEQEIERLLADPLRLGSDAVLAHAREVLASARAINPQGARLSGQIATLETTIQQAAATVPVAIHSDNRTHVTVLRVVDLGRVQTTNLSLRPGRYVATGSRNGYRDVRVEFEVPLSGTPVSLEVVCREPVG